MDSGSGSLLTMYDEILNILYVAAKIYFILFSSLLAIPKAVSISSISASISGIFYYADFL